MVILDVILAMAYRQILRFLRTPSRLISAALMPVIWLVFFGMGFSSLLASVGGRAQYLTFLAPGIVALTIFNGGLVSGFTVIFDRQFGFLKETLIAPVPRWAVILGRAIGDAANALIQAIPVMAIAVLLAGVSPIGALTSLPACYLSAFVFSSLGVLMASRVSTHEAFQMLMTFFMMPAIFLSSVFYPLSTMPNWMKFIALINPLTYSADLLRSITTGICELGYKTDVVALAISAIALSALAGFEFERASIED